MGGPWAPYSENFLYAEGDDPGNAMEVPEGKRAVLTFFSGSMGGSTQVAAYLKVHGIYCWMTVLPAGQGNGWAEQLRLVAYERETIEVQVFGVNVGWHLSGYLFDDPVGRPSWPMVLPTWPAEEPPWRPPPAPAT